MKRKVHKDKSGESEKYQHRGDHRTCKGLIFHSFGRVSLIKAILVTEDFNVLFAVGWEILEANLITTYM